MKNEEKNEIKNGIMIAIVVILIIVVAYFTTAVFMTGEIGNGKVTKDKTTTKNTPSNNFDNEIIAGRVFNQKEDTYMVLIFSNDDIKDELKSTINKYDVSKKDVKLYKVNKDEAVNKYISSDYDNNTPISSKDLKVKKMALLTISKGVVSSYITDEEEIINVLK